jgi:hypothetical protein
MGLEIVYFDMWLSWVASDVHCHHLVIREQNSALFFYRPAKRGAIIPSDIAFVKHMRIHVSWLLMSLIWKKQAAPQLSRRAFEGSGSKACFQPWCRSRATPRKRKTDAQYSSRTIGRARVWFICVKTLQRRDAHIKGAAMRNFIDLRCFR